MYAIYKIHRTDEQWFQERGKILFTWNILNPNGPTISCAGIRDTGVEGQVEVFYRWMHFLGGESYVLGYADLNDNEEAFVESLRQIFKYAFTVVNDSALNGFPMVSCVPSFVTAAESPLSASDLFEFISSAPEFLGDDWGAQRYYLKKFGSQFFDRAAEETRNAVEMAREAEGGDNDFLKFTEFRRGKLPFYKNWQPHQFQSRPIMDGDAEAWWKTINTEEFTSDCLFQLAYAWVGAIYQYQNGNLDKPVAEPFERVRDFLATFNHGLWPADLSSGQIREVMGIGGRS